MAETIETINILEFQLKASDALKQAAALQKQLEGLRKTQKDLDTTTEEGKLEYQRLGVEIKAVGTQLRATQKDLFNSFKQASQLDGSVNQLRASISKLTAEYYALSRADREGARGMALGEEIQKMQKEVNAAEQTLLNFRSNVGNYASAFNPLQFQISQVARELPSLTISAQQFFLAISNNLPMLVDELKRAKDANAALNAEGQKTVPVWKQVLKGALSWNTALVLGITLLTAYGKEIGNVVSNLFKARKEFDAAAASQKAYNDAINAGNKDAVEELTRLKLVYDAATDVTESLDKRTEAVRQMREMYPDYLQNLSDEEILAGKAATQYIELRDKIIEAARSRAAFNKIVENQQQILSIQSLPEFQDIEKFQSQIEASYQRIEELKNKGIADNYYQIKTQYDIINQRQKQIEKSTEKIKESLDLKTEANDIRDYVSALEAANKQLESSAALQFTTSPVQSNTSSNSDTGNSVSNKLKESADDAEELAKNISKYYEKQRESILSMFDRTIEERIQEVRDQYAKAFAALDDQTKAEAKPIASAYGTPQEYQEALDKYNDFLLEQAVIRKRLEEQQIKEIQQLQDESLRQQTEQIEREVQERYAGDYAAYAANERKKLETTIKAMNEQKALKVLNGIETYEEDAKINEATRKLEIMTLNQQLFAARDSAKKTFEIKKEYLEKELEAAKGNADAENAITQQLEDNRKQYIQSLVDSVNQWASAVQEIMQNVLQLMQANNEAELQYLESKYDKETQMLEEQHERGLMSDKEYNQKQKELDDNYQKQKEKLQQEQAKKEKAVNMFQIIINTATAIMQSFAQLGPIAGAVAAASMAAIGAVQLATVASQPLPKAARGRKITGKRHSQGGEIIEAEDGEVIINRRSAQQFEPLLSAINMAGGGIPFGPMPSDGGFASRYAMQAGLTEQAIVKAVERGVKSVKIYTTVEDIRRADRKYTQVESAGTI